MILLSQEALGGILSEEPAVPEDQVGVGGMNGLIASVSVVSAGVNHQLELLVGLLEGVDELEGVLHVDIVIGSSVGDAEHRALAAAVLFGTFPYTGEGITLGIVLGSIHVPLGIMGVVELPVVHSAAGYTVLEVVGAVGQGQDGHRAAEGESGDADLLSVHVGEGPQVLHPLDVVGQLGLSEGAVDVVDALLAAVAGGAVVD